MSGREYESPTGQSATTPTSFGAIVGSSVGTGGVGISSGDGSVYSPNIPYVGIIPHGLVPGKSILIKGLVLSSRDKKLTINLSCGLLVEGEKPDDIALHIDFRFDENSLVLNTLTAGSWGSERRFANPARRGQAVEVRVLAEADSFNVAVNGQNICEFAYRLALQTVKTLYIKGCVQVDAIQYEQNDWQSGDSLEHGVPATSPLYRPPVPFTCSVPGKFVPGRSQIIVTGTPRLHAHLFLLNVKCGKDTALHVSVRFHEQQKAVVLNSRRNGRWEQEKRQEIDFPFLKGGTFDLAIRTDYNGFNLRVNGRHFMDFPHRFQPDTIDGLEIEGDLQLQQVWFKM